MGCFLEEKNCCVRVNELWTELKFHLVKLARYNLQSSKMNVHTKEGANTNNVSIQT